MLILDNFITDKNLLKDLQDTDSSFWTRGYRWWSNTNKANSLRHKLIQYIWLEKRIPYLIKNIAGFEHWVGIYDNQSGVDDRTEDLTIQGEVKRFSLIHHRDKDEGLWAKTGETVSPLIGCIYYPILKQRCTGGKLRIYETPDEDFSAPYNLLVPVPNRLIVFNPGQLHAVEEVTEGTRYAIAINVWKNELSPEQQANFVEYL